MRPQASLRRSETSRRKIQSRFSVFTTSSQNKNPAPSVNPGTKQLWQTRCDTSANDEISETNIWFHQQWSTSETNIWWITTNMMKFQKQTSDFIKGEPMKFQTQTSDFINTWCLRNAHLTSSTLLAQTIPDSNNNEVSDINWLHQQIVTRQTHIWRTSTHQKVWRHLSGNIAN
jgi:hypothetical protein